MRKKEKFGYFIEDLCEYLLIEFLLLNSASLNKLSTSRGIATRLKEHSAAIRNYTIEALFMASQREDTAHDIDLTKVKILSHAISWTTSSFKEAWLSNENSIEKCHIELPQA